MNQQLLNDRIKGMVYFSLYGDCIGFPHEFNFDLNSEVRMQTKDEFLELKHCSDPWGCWEDFDNISPESSGILSDDSYYKLEIFIPYLKKHQFYEDRTFIDFCLESLNQRVSGSKRAQIVDWLYMFVKLDLPQELIEKIEHKITCEEQTQNFYDPQISSCFGLFLFLWQGVSGKAGATLFDSAEGSKVTQKILSTLSPALLTGHLDVAQLLKGYDEGLYDHLQGFLKNLGDEDVADLRSALYSYRKSLPRPVVALKHDPLEFLICFAACQQIFPDNPLKSLHLVCSSGGDTDTAGAIWGSLLGAQFGYQHLIDSYPHVKEDFQEIDQFLQSQNISLDECFETLESIASLRRPQ